MAILVFGGTGTVGREVVRQLVARGEKVCVATRHADTSVPSGVEPRTADLTDPYSVGPVFDGIERVFLLNAVSPTEVQEGLCAVEWARRAGVKKIVYLSVQAADAAWHIPHFGGKVVIENAIRESGFEFTILRPNNFFQNDYWVKDAIVSHGVYPQPLGGVGVNRVDVRDIGEAAVKALTTPAGRNETFVLAGRDALTGQACADVYSRHLGRPVRYAGDDLDRWEQQARQMYPPALAFDFRMMYGLFHERGLLATAEDLRRLEAFLGHAPRRFDSFVAETVQQWMAGV
jgi:uncharacterized protein YbjT (DUF2867 family)